MYYIVDNIIEDSLLNIGLKELNSECRRKQVLLIQLSAFLF